MATTTTNLSLVKPASTDTVQVSTLNGNMDILDGAVGDLQDDVYALQHGGMSEERIQQMVDDYIDEQGIIDISATAESVSPSQSASVTRSGTTSRPVFNFKIPRGADGAGAVDTVDGVAPISGDVALPVMTGASASAAGAAGKVPAPASGDNAKFLRGDGTWQTVSTEDIPDNVLWVDTASQTSVTLATSAELSAVDTRVTALETKTSVPVLLTAGDGDYTRQSIVSTSWTPVIQTNTMSGWNQLTLTFATTAQITSGTKTKIAAIPAETVAIVGRTYVVGLGRSGSTLVEILFDTYSETTAIYVTPVATLSSGATISGGMAFPVTP